MRISSSFGPPSYKSWSFFLFSARFLFPVGLSLFRLCRHFVFSFNISWFFIALFFLLPFADLSMTKAIQTRSSSHFYFGYYFTNRWCLCWMTGQGKMRDAMCLLMAQFPHMHALSLSFSFLFTLFFFILNTFIPFWFSVFGPPVRRVKFKSTLCHTQRLTCDGLTATMHVTRPATSSQFHHQSSYQRRTK